MFGPQPLLLRGLRCVPGTAPLKQCQSVYLSLKLFQNRSSYPTDRVEVKRRPSAFPPLTFGPSFRLRLIFFPLSFFGLLPQRGFQREVRSSKRKGEASEQFQFRNKARGNFWNRERRPLEKKNSNSLLPSSSLSSLEIPTGEQPSDRSFFVSFEALPPEVALT